MAVSRRCRVPRAGLARHCVVAPRREADVDADADADADADVDTGDPLVPVDYCHLQWPCTLNTASGTPSSTLYVWVYQAGVTEGVGVGPGIQVEVGVGPDGSNPATSSSWVWSGASYNVDTDGLSVGDRANDEYSGNFVAPLVSGSYDYCGRVSADGGRSWAYCDLGGSGCGGSGSSDGYSAVTTGNLTVP